MVEGLTAGRAVLAETEGTATVAKVVVVAMTVMTETLGMVALAVMDALWLQRQVASC